MIIGRQRSNSRLDLVSTQSRTGTWSSETVQTATRDDRDDPRVQLAFDERYSYQSEVSACQRVDETNRFSSPATSKGTLDSPGLRASSGPYAMRSDDAGMTVRYRVGDESEPPAAGDVHRHGE